MTSELRPTENCFGYQASLIDAIVDGDDEANSILRLEPVVFFNT